MEKKLLPKGVWGASFTPFDKDGKIIVEGVKEIMDYNIENGMDAFFVGGSTGEGTLMSVDQRMELAELMIGYNKGRVPMIVHVGSTDTATAVKLTAHAKSIGADGVCSVIPYYNPMNLDYVREYYKAISREADMPVLVYYMPTTSSFQLTVDFVADLVKDPNIVGVKYTGMNMEEFRKIKDYNNGEIQAYIGFDAMLLNALTMGGDGGVGAWYNVMTKACCKIYDCFAAGDFAQAQALQWRVCHYIALIKKFAKPAIQPVGKAVLNSMGFNAGTVLGPFLPMNDLDQQTMVDLLKKEGFYEFVRDCNV